MLNIRFWHLAGSMVQALFLGVLLFIAISGLIALETGARVFRYQAF